MRVLQLTTYATAHEKVDWACHPSARQPDLNIVIGLALDDHHSRAYLSHEGNVIVELAFVDSCFNRDLVLKPRPRVVLFR